MGWEKRGDSGRGYYYTKKKVGGRVVSTYAGKGLAGALAAKEQQAKRAQRTAATAAEREAREQVAACEASLAAFCDLTDALVHAALRDAGYHRHHRGEWRKRRG